MTVLMSSAASAALQTLDRAAERAIIARTPEDKRLIERCADLIILDLRGVPPRVYAPLLRVRAQPTTSTLRWYLKWRRTHAGYRNFAG